MSVLHTVGLRRESLQDRIFHSYFIGSNLLAAQHTQRQGQHQSPVGADPFASSFQIDKYLIAFCDNSLREGSKSEMLLQFPLPAFEISPPASLVRSFPKLPGMFISKLEVSKLTVEEVVYHSPLLLELSIPAIEAKAWLAVAAPHVVGGLNSTRVAVPSGSVSWFADVSDKVCAAKALAQAQLLIAAAHFSSLPPVGSAVVVSCPLENKMSALGQIAQALGYLGCGPFAPLHGIAPDEMNEAFLAEAALCSIYSQDFCNAFELGRQQENIDALYGDDLAAVSDLSSCINIATATHAALAFIARGSAPDLSFGVRNAGSFIARVKLWAKEYGISQALLLHAAAQAALFSQESVLAVERFEYELECFCRMGEDIGSHHSRPESSDSPDCYGEAGSSGGGNACGRSERSNQSDDSNWSDDSGVSDDSACPDSSNRADSLICPDIGLTALNLPAGGIRLETDSVGSIPVPAHAAYGSQTERSIHNFAVGSAPIGQNRKFVRAMALVKLCAAEANMQTGMLDEVKGKAITQAAREVMAGLWDDSFPVDTLQGGGGVGMNMNINEVVAYRASSIMHGILSGKADLALVHPNDDVNMCHSTNDLVHTAMHIAFLQWTDELLEKMRNLEGVFNRLATQFSETVKLGRTCLMDALPITMGQQFSGYAAFVSRRKKSLEAMKEECLHLAMGAGGIGTGIGVSPGFLKSFFEVLSQHEGVAFKPAANYFDALQHTDFYIELSAQLKAYATGLSNIARDLRLMGSGPRAGFGELVLPAVQPGSSIMPGKINPLIPELINQIAYVVCGNDTAVSFASEGSDVDLNVWEAVFLQGISSSFQLLCNGTAIFTDKCLEGLNVNAQKCRQHAETSLALATVISEVFGYKKGVEIAGIAVRENCSIKEAAVNSGLVTTDAAELLLDPALLTKRDKYAEIIDAFRRGRSTPPNSERLDCHTTTQEVHK